VDLNTDELSCSELADAEVRDRRARAWREAAAANGGVHPHVRPVDSRVLARMRSAARPALQGAGMATD
jgi:dihydroxy-acid dehydratase